MCGPLACAVLSKSRLRTWQSTALYNVGRGLSYCAAGAVVGLASESISNAWPALTGGMSIIFGALICLWALVGVLGGKRRFALNPLAKGLSSVQAAVRQLPAALSAFGLGILTIFLPCMTLHPLLLMSAAHQDSLSGATTMLAFFAGTVPAMVSATYMPTLIARSSGKISYIRFGHVFLFIAGLLTIGRAFFHHH
jgi:sulfite exporter TauE/SafE